MQYEQAVQEARRLDHVIEEAESTAEDAKWARAELAWEQVQAGISRRQWARDTGKHHETINDWVQMWERWGTRRPRPPFAEAHNIIRGRSAEVDEHGSQYQASARQAVRNLPPERKAEVARELVADLPFEHRGQIMRDLVAEPKVADSVMRDPHTRRNITDARMRIVDEIETAARDRDQSDNLGRAVREATLTVEIDNDISAARWRLAEAARKLTNLADRDPAVLARFARELDDVDTARDWLRTLIAGGTVSDEELAKLLEGGAP